MPARTAHWARVASAIRKQQGITWEEAKNVYRRLTTLTKRELGRSAGLVDLRERRERIGSITRYVQTIGPYVEAKRGSFEDRLNRKGLEGFRWHGDSARLDESGAPPVVVERLASSVAGAARDVARQGFVSAKRKETLKRIFGYLEDEYGWPGWEYFNVLRSLYTDE